MWQALSHHSSGVLLLKVVVKDCTNARPFYQTGIPAVCLLPHLLHGTCVMKLALAKHFESLGLEDGLKVV